MKRIIGMFLLIPLVSAADVDPKQVQRAIDDLAAIRQTSRPGPECQAAIATWIRMGQDPDVLAVLLESKLTLSEQWKAKWKDDTQALAKEMRQMVSQLAEESAARVKAENKAAMLEKDLAELKPRPEQPADKQK